MKKLTALLGVLALIITARAAAPPAAGPDGRIVIPAGHTMQGVPLNTMPEEYGDLAAKLSSPRKTSRT